MSSAIRTVALAALAVAVWALAKYGVAMPTPLPADAPSAQFSALRADATLARILGPERPHPASTPENAAVRARILKEFATLGVPATAYTGMGCNLEKRAGVLACGTVTDIIAPVLPGEGKAVVLLAHYDSVPAGPGAADDESGVATVLETARALRAKDGKTLHPVMAVLTDGEEYGLLGAAAFLADPALRDRVGVAINVEARGNRGQSRLFQTSPGAAKLIDLYAANVSSYATSSLYAEIYKYMPNDTDLTPFIHDGLPSVNFAFADNVAHYHTPLDLRRNLSLATLQQHGDNMLGMAAALAQTDFAGLKSHDEVYVDVLGRWLPRFPQSWALPGAIALLILLIVAMEMSRGEKVSMRERLRAAAIFPTLLAGAALTGWLLSFVAQFVSGMPDPAYAHPVALRIALALGVAGAAILVSRLSRARVAVANVWYWFALLGIVTAAFVPGFSPYFLLPLAVAVVAMLATARTGPQSAGREAALLVSALAALVLWLGLATSGETLMGLKLHPLFTVPAAIGAATLVPLLAARTLSARVWRFTAGGCFAGALVAVIIAGFQPSYCETSPQRLNLNYIVDNGTGNAYWAADATAPLPPSLRAAAKFSATPETPYPSSRLKAYLAPAEHAQVKIPGAAVVANARVGNGRRVTLKLEGSSDAAMMWLVLPGAAGLKSATLGQKTVRIPADWAEQKRVVIACMTADCASLPVTLEMANMGALNVTLIERRAGLPAFGARLAAARGKLAVPSQFGDGIVLIAPLTVAGL